MANLSTARRSALRSSSFGLPGRRKTKNRIKMEHGGAVHGSDMDFKTIRGKIQNFGRAVRDRFSPPSVSRPVSEAGTKAAIDTARQIAPAVDQMSVLKRREAAAGLNRGGMVNGLRGYKKGGMVRGYRK